MIDLNVLLEILFLTNLFYIVTKLYQITIFSTTCNSQLSEALLTLQNVTYNANIKKYEM
jgi:hypothetical protein